MPYLKSTLILLPVLLVLSSCLKDEGDLALGDYYAPEIVGEQYNEIEENPFVSVATDAISTFSVDADGASYANVRRLINYDIRPPSAAIRTEELINYFPMDYPEPTGQTPIAVHGEVSECPWADDHKLLRIGIKGKSFPAADLPPSNIVLLMDVSGSMEASNKLELLKDGFRLLVNEFDANDRISIVTYAGSSAVKLPPTAGDQKHKINTIINSLGAGGSTAGADGINTAYELAFENLVPGGNNRIIIGTDGDFNVGPSSQEELIELIEEKRDLGVFLTVLGVGTGNYNDGVLEQMANHGNGTYEYIDNIDQARKVFIEEFQKFYTVAKDVKVQVAFNPDIVDQYRLIGYENRLLEDDEFEIDSTDAGEIGAGQTITALYEIIPTPNPNFLTIPTFSIDFRYKKPDGNSSIPLSMEVLDQGNTFANASENMRFAASVASFGLLLRSSEYKGNTSFDAIINWASQARTFDPFGYRQDYIDLVQEAKEL